MRVNFLRDSDGTRLAKTFTPDETAPYPQSHHFTSYTHDVANLDEFYEALQIHAAEGNCLLKGLLTRPLTAERRAGSTDSLLATEYAVLDLDFDEGFDDIDSFLSALGLSGIDYILHHSASSGIRARPGLRAHIILQFSRPQSPASLKVWLQEKNLLVVGLRQNLQLTATRCALRWALDVTTCQNDKLIFIADPNVQGLVDPMAGKRFEIHKRGRPTIDLDLRPTISNLDEQITIAVNDLREAAGLRPVRPQFKSARFGTETFDYLSNPNRATVTGHKSGRGFTYVNLNGGDSWGYYFPEGRPDYLFNFKGEPVVRLRDIDPDFYSAITESRRAEREVLANQTFAFREPSTDEYYTVEVEGEEVSVNKIRRTNLGDFFGSRHMEAPDAYAEWTYQFDPTSTQQIDRDRRYINMFRPTQYLLTTYEPVPFVPPTIGRVLRSICVDQETYDLFINWLAYLFQTRKQSRVAWIFRGTFGTGKGVMFNQILSPLFGAKHCLETTTERMKEHYTSDYNDKIFIMVDEGELDDRDTEKLITKLKGLITEPMFESRAMRSNAVSRPNFTNWIIATNKVAAMKMENGDRRWNVAPCQTKKIELTREEIEVLLGGTELEQFAAYLQHYAVDEFKATTATNTAAKAELTIQTESSIDRIFRAMKEGDLDWFLEQTLETDTTSLMNPKMMEFMSAVRRWSNCYTLGEVCVSSSELKAAYEFLSGNNTSPVKFGRIAAARWTPAVLIRDSDIVFRGWRVQFHATHLDLIAKINEAKNQQSRLQVVR